MNESANKESVTEVAKELFDDSVERLDAATLSRLNQCRRRALQEVAQPAGKKPWGLWVPASGVAVAALLAVMVMRGPADTEIVEGAVDASDFEMLLEADSLEMFEHLEFYSLLDELDSEIEGDVG